MTNLKSKGVIFKREVLHSPVSRMAVSPLSAKSYTVQFLGWRCAWTAETQFKFC
jgi:hypothetical protein